jgi:hypothetical protein
VCSRGVWVALFTLCGLALDEGGGGADGRRRAGGNRGAGAALRACVGAAICGKQKGFYVKVAGKGLVWAGVDWA